MIRLAAASEAPQCPACGSTDTALQDDIASMRDKGTALPGHAMCRACLHGWNPDAPGWGYRVQVVL